MRDIRTTRAMRDALAAVPRLLDREYDREVERQRVEAEQARISWIPEAPPRPHWGWMITLTEATRSSGTAASVERRFRERLPSMFRAIPDLFGSRHAAIGGVLARGDAEGHPHVHLLVALAPGQPFDREDVWSGLERVWRRHGGSQIDLTPVIEDRGIVDYIAGHGDDDWFHGVECPKRCRRTRCPFGYRRVGGDQVVLAPGRAANSRG
jgi:hypothetical protein